MEQKPSSARVALKWGIIAALTGIVLATIIYMADLWKIPAIGFLSFIPLIIFIYMAMKEFRTENGGFMSYSQGLGVGMLTGVISGIVGAAFDMLYKKLIDTNLNERIMDYQYQKMSESGMDEQQIDAAMDITAKLTSGGIQFVMAVVIAAIGSLIVSLIVAAVLKKDKPVF
ncbi:DUF4199 domain-containing protein [Marinilongibacter aquaticus]|uniref:DUF4199 domain-containing protein n=1 Tax=Marinilongibacter aquaticus TaxID=2975157 RepID=UPI0021BD4F4B|nr:DUF4199 domain-containing protein [Marinilongibacter aquaticus]UBM59821.1 DUF4199 domain-containing protein [Marinilongibacter aquaticus]